jgi:hypothetical protein
MATKTSDMNIPVLATIGVTSVILVVVIVLGAQGWIRTQTAREYEAKVVNQPNLALQNLNSAAESHLTEYRWIDRDNNIAAIPLNEAMREVVRRYGQGGELAQHEALAEPVEN